MSKPAISPGTGPVGTMVKVSGTCKQAGLGAVQQAVVGFYYADAFSMVSGYDMFHEVSVAGPKAASYSVKLKVGPAHKYTTKGPGGAAPGPEVLRKPKQGDRLFVQTLCYYALSAYPDYKSAASAFKVTASPVKNTTLPSIRGKAVVGRKLTADPGAWRPKPASYAFKWKRGGKLIRGATKASYTLTAKDRGKRVTVTVSVRKPGYAVGSATSRAVLVR